MNGEEKGELVSQLRDYVILTLLLRKGLISEADIQEQIAIVRSEVPVDHPAYTYLMDQFAQMERMMPPSPHGSPISNDPMVPTD